MDDVDGVIAGSRSRGVHPSTTPSSVLYSSLPLALHNAVEGFTMDVGCQ